MQLIFRNNSAGFYSGISVSYQISLFGKPKTKAKVNI